MSDGRSPKTRKGKNLKQGKGHILNACFSSFVSNVL
jgi:hypothetical protein